MDERPAPAGRGPDDPVADPGIAPRLPEAGGLDTEDALDAEDELDAREAERIRRRDHDADAGHRSLMRSGMGKVFKQILDRQARDANDSRDHGSRRDR